MLDSAAEREGRGPERGWTLTYYVLLWAAVTLLWARPLESNLIDGLLIAAFAIAFVRLPSEYAATAAALALLLLSLHDGFSSRYVSTWRWVLSFGGAVVFYFRFGLAGDRAARPSVFRAMMLAFVAACVASALASIAATASLAKCLSLASAVGACWFLAQGLMRQYGAFAAKKFSEAWTWALAPSIAATAAAYLAGTTPTLGSVFPLGSFRGASGNANSFAGAIAFLLPHVLARVAVARRSEFQKAAAPIGLAGLLGYWLLISRSRTSVLAAAAAAAVVAVIHPRGYIARVGLIAVALFAVSVLATPPDSVARRATDWLYKGRASVVTSRAALWEQAQERFLERPLLGFGFGVTTASESLDATRSTLRTVRVEQGSSFWALLAQTGIAGFLPMALALIEVLVRSLRFAFAVRDPYLTGIVASVCGLTVHSLFEGWLVSTGNGLLWVMLLQCFVLDAITSRFRPPSRLRPLGPLPSERSQPYTEVVAGR